MTSKKKTGTTSTKDAGASNENTNQDAGQGSTPAPTPASKKPPEPKLHVVEIISADGKVIQSFNVRETGKLQAKNVVLEGRINVRRATENEIMDIASSGATVLGIPRVPVASNQPSLLDGATSLEDAGLHGDNEGFDPGA